MKRWEFVAMLKLGPLLGGIALLVVGYVWFTGGGDET